MKESNSIKETILIWVLNLGALALTLLPLLQFIAVVLAIFVSISTLIINWNKVKSIFKL
jgi:phosphoglycerol transferase MdoB-like AlkP superfamily enzyme